MTVYGDLLFLINFSMDFLCFYLSCLLLHRKMKLGRTFIASVLGGIYSVLALFVSTNGTIALLIDILVLVLMCWIAYGVGKSGFKALIKAIFLYFFVSALLGGLMTALFSLFNSLKFEKIIGSASDGIDVWIFAFLAIIGSVMTIRGGKIFRTSFSSKEVLLKIESEMGEEKFSALVDSGNLATEPISGKSVVFISVEKCKKIIDNKLYNAIKNNSIVDDIEISLENKIRLIPTKVLSGTSILPAKKFNKVLVINGKNEKEIDVYIAFVNWEKLGKYDAIISHETII